MTKPGKATSAEGMALVDGANQHCSSAIASRAEPRPARSSCGCGPWRQVRRGAGTGLWQRPYLLSLYRRDFGDYTADCDCPYGCTELYWCKHAVALAYVVADIIEHDPSILLRWTGDPPAEVAVGVRIQPDRLARLTEPIQELDVAQVMAAAAEVAPPPGV